MNGTPEQPTSVRWRIVGLMMALSFMSWFNRVSISVAGTERIIGQYHISPTRMGFVYSVLIFAYALCMTPGGFVIDRRGAWWALAVMGFGSAVFVALTGVVGLVFFSAGAVWLMLLVVRAGAGVFMAPIYPGCGRVISHWLPLPRRAWANGLVNGAAPVGVACTFVGFGALIDWFDWPAAFILTGLLTAVLALAWLLYACDRPSQHPGVNAAELELIGDEVNPLVPSLPGEEAHKHFEIKPPREVTDRSGFQALRASFAVVAGALRWGRRSQAVPDASAPAAPAADWLHLLDNRSLIFLTIGYAAVNYFEYLFMFWTEYYFKDVRHLETEVSRVYSMVLNLSMGAGMMLGGLVSDRLLPALGYRWGRAAVPIGGLLTAAALLGAGLLVREPLAVVVCFAVALAAGGACEGPSWATAIELGGRRGGTSAAIFNTGGNAGGLLAPVVTPWVSARLGWHWGIGLGALACLFAVGLWFAIDPAERATDAGG